MLWDYSFISIEMHQDINLDFKMQTYCVKIALTCSIGEISVVMLVHREYYGLLSWYEIEFAEEF